MLTISTKVLSIRTHIKSYADKVDQCKDSN